MGKITRLVIAAVLLLILWAATLQVSRFGSQASVSNVEPGVFQGVNLLNGSVQPAMVFGLVVSVAGALVLGLSVIVLSRRKA